MRSRSGAHAILALGAALTVSMTTAASSYASTPPVPIIDDVTSAYYTPEVGDYFWTGGTSWDRDQYMGPVKAALPPGKTEIVAVDIAPNNHVYTWYSDGTVSSGTFSDLDAHKKPYSYSLPPGKTRWNVRGIAISKSSRVYTWYSDETVSVGTSWDLDAYQAPSTFSVPDPAFHYDGSLTETAIAKSNDHVYAWWHFGGEASSGTSRDLDRYRKPYSSTEHEPAPGTADVLEGIGISASDRVYTLYHRVKYVPVG